MSKEVNEERTPRTVTDVKEMLTKHSNGEIQRTIQNCITILQNDHDLKDMEWLCRRLIILEKGEILFDDEITKIFDNYPEAETLEEIIIELFNGNTKK